MARATLGFKLSRAAELQQTGMARSGKQGLKERPRAGRGASTSGVDGRANVPTLPDEMFWPRGRPSPQAHQDEFDAHGCFDSPHFARREGYGLGEYWSDLILDSTRNLPCNTTGRSATHHLHFVRAEYCVQEYESRTPGAKKQWLRTAKLEVPDSCKVFCNDGVVRETFPIRVTPRDGGRPSSPLLVRHCVVFSAVTIASGLSPAALLVCILRTAFRPPFRSRSTVGQ